MQAEQVESGGEGGLIYEPSSWKLQWKEVPLRPMWAAAGDPVSNSNRALLKLVLSDCLPPMTARMLLGSL